MPVSAREPKTLFSVVFLVALATLLLEVSLIRVFSYTIWHHFGYVVISMALLGYGASGTALAVAPRIGTPDLARTLARCAALAGVTAAGMLGLMVAWPLDPMAIFSNPGQAAAFVVYQIGAALPFFFSGLVISLALREAASRVDRLYFWDLVGGGLGCAAAVPMMNWLSPPGTVVLAAALFLGAAMLVSPEPRMRLVAGGLAAVFLLSAGSAVDLPFTVAGTKELALQVNQMGMEPRFSRWRAIFRTDVVENVRNDPRPGYFDWGLSRKAINAPRPKFFFHHDGTAGTGGYDLRGQARLDHLDSHILHFPYLVTRPAPRVLVIGVGAGRDVITAHQYGASEVVGVELDPVAIDLLRNGLNAISDGFFRRGDIQLVAGEGRHYIRTTPKKFDLIQITGVDTLSAEFSGSYVLAENYLYTVEAFRDYLDHLALDGILSIGTGDFNENRPRATGRMVTVAQQALRADGARQPERHIAVIYGTFLNEVLIRKVPFQPGHVQQLAGEAERLGFRSVLLPGRPGNETFTMLASATGDELDRFLDKLPYVVSPTHDDRPFFFSFFRWGEVLREGLGPAHSTSLGQTVLLALLATLTLLGVLLILGPLVVLRWRGAVAGGWATLSLLAYFLAIGAGFMLFEISLIQRFVIFLGYPTYSLSVILFSLLVFLGVGSYLSRRWVGRERVVLPLAVLVLAGLVLFYVEGLPPLQARLLGASLAVRVALSIAVLAPLGLTLGSFFPLGIRRANAVSRDLVAWAWSVNGCASVTGGVLAVVLAITYGFTRVWILSLCIYAAGVTALLAGPRPPEPSETSDAGG